MKTQTSERLNDLVHNEIETTKRTLGIKNLIIIKENTNQKFLCKTMNIYKVSICEIKI